MAVERYIPAPAPEGLAEALQPAQDRYFSQGYTVATEGATPVEAIPALRSAARRGLLLLDVIALPEIHSAPKMAGKPEFALGVNVDHVKIGGLKAIVDGSPQGGTGYYTKPYLVPGASPVPAADSSSPTPTATPPSTW
jgi:predicted amidohydrolase YtcJ